MKAFSKDKDNATLNPLFKSSKPRSTALAINNKGTATTRHGTRIQIAIRILLFLVTPLTCIWSMEDTFVQNHMITLTYLQVIIVVIAQGVLIRSFLNQRKNKIGSVIIAATLMYVLTCLLCRNVVPNYSGMLASVKTAGCEIKCGECAYFTEHDFPQDIFPGFIPDGQEKAFGVGVSEGGKKLSKEIIQKVMGNVKILYTGFQAAFHVDATICNNLFKKLLAGSFLGPCNRTCEASKPTSAECTEHLENSAGCIADINTMRQRSFDYAMGQFAFLTLYPEPEADALIKLLLIKKAKEMDNALSNFTDGSAFCKNSDLFDSNARAVFNCSTSGQYSAASSSARRLSNISAYAKVAWTALVLAISFYMFFCVPAFEKTITKPIFLIDTLQIYVCITFLTILISLVFQKLLLFERRSDANEWESIVWEAVVAHTNGLVLAMAAFLFCTTLMALQGKKPRIIDTNEKNVFLKWWHIFQVLTDVDDGEYYFMYTVLFEFVEATLQMSTFDVMVRNNDLDYVVASTIILSLNLMMTPLAFMLSRFNETWGRHATYITDTILESGYLFVNLNATTRNDLLGSPFVMLSILFPVCTLMGKVDTLVESLATHVTNKERRDSWVRVGLATLRGKISRSKMGKSSLRKNVTRLPSRVKQEKSFAKSLNWQQRIALCVGMAMGISGVAFFVYMIGNVIFITEDCGRKLGKEIWEGSRPRYVFKDGPFEKPKCHFETIQSVKAPGRGVTEVTGYIGELVNLREVDLSDNEIKSLPKQITVLKQLSKKNANVSFHGNPVWSNLNWENQAFSSYPEILVHFTELRTLSLRRNQIKSIPISISRLGKLNVLLLQNNSIHHLPHEITLLSKLQQFSVEYNPVARSLRLRSNDPLGALRILGFMNRTMRDLDLSGIPGKPGLFNTNNVVTVLHLLPHLKRLNVSENKLGDLSFGINFKNIPLTMLDVSRNPVQSVRLGDLYNMDYVRKRGNVFIQELHGGGGEGFTSDLKDIDASVDFPSRLLGQYFQHNDLMNVLFIGDNHERFPVCQLKTVISGLVILGAYNLSIGCINRLINLQSISLAGYNWSSVDFDTSTLTKLLYLHLERNSLKSINFDTLNNLQYMYLGSNRLTNIDEIKLTELRYLYLNNNHLNQHINVGNLTNLIDIRLDNNRFNGSVPHSLSKLKNLKCMNLKNNQFQGGLPWIEQLTNLEIVELRNNSLSGTLSLTPSQYKKMKFLGVGGSGLAFNRSYITSMFPHLLDYGDHFCTHTFVENAADCLEEDTTWSIHA